jgi:SPP1 family predicted phage head-tail adaptor
MIGQLDQRVTFQRSIKVDNNVGGYTETWIDIATVWGSVQELLTNERVRFKELGTDVRYGITIRSPAPVVTEKDRVVIDGTLYGIVEVRTPRKRGDITTVLANLGTLDE